MIIKLADNRDSNRFGKPKVETNLCNLTQENLIRIVDEAAKIQPQYAQSLSIVQLDCIQPIKNAVLAVIHDQKQITDISWTSWNGNGPKTHFMENFAKQSQEIPRNAIRALKSSNQLTINALEATREYLKIYNKSIDAITEFSAGAAKAWNLLCNKNSATELASERLFWG